MWRKRKRRRGRAGPAPHPVFQSEPLETRRLFGGHTVNGTDGNDTIVVNFVAVRDNFVVNEYRVTVNGQLQTFRAITAQIRGLDGDDADRCPALGEAEGGFGRRPGLIHPPEPVQRRRLHSQDRRCGDRRVGFRSQRHLVQQLQSLLGSALDE